MKGGNLDDLHDPKTICNFMGGERHNLACIRNSYFIIKTSIKLTRSNIERVAFRRYCTMPNCLYH